MRNDNHTLAEGAEVLANDELLSLGDQTVRVMRVMVFEGPASSIRRQLGKSLPDGDKTFNGVLFRVVTGKPTVVSVKR